jgi:hypothetical protein
MCAVLCRGLTSEYPDPFTDLQVIRHLRQPPQSLFQSSSCINSFNTLLSDTLLSYVPPYPPFSHPLPTLSSSSILFLILLYSFSFFYTFSHSSTLFLILLHSFSFFYTLSHPSTLFLVLLHSFSFFYALSHSSTYFGLLRNPYSCSPSSFSESSIISLNHRLYSNFPLQFLLLFITCSLLNVHCTCIFISL